jgi:hypothetical protein
MMVKAGFSPEACFAIEAKAAAFYPYRAAKAF